MVTLTITEKGGKAATREFDKPEVTIGRIQGNDIVLPKSNISKRHARIIQNGDGFVIIDSKSTNGTYINGKRIDAPYDLQSGDKIFVGDFTIEIEADEDDASVSQARGRDDDDDDMDDDDEDDAPPPPKSRKAREEEPPPPKKEKAKPKTEDVLPDEDWDAGDDADSDWADDWDASQSKAKPSSREESRRDDKREEKREEKREDKRDESKRAEKPKRREESAIEEKAKVKKEDSKPAKREESRKEPAVPPKPTKREREPSVGAMGDDASQALRVVHERLLRSLDLRRLGVETMDEEELRTRTRTSVEEIVTSMQEAGELPASVEPRNLIDDVLEEALGVGPLEDLLQDNSVNEIMVNGANQIYVERDGKISRVDRSFSSDQAVLGVIERIVAPLGRRIDESSPMVDARLKDGSRVNAIIPPLAIGGPTLTIRKFTREPLEIDDLVASGAVTAAMATFLETCVKARKNILVSGATGSGKTTTLNVLASFIGDGERVVTIEDDAELKLEGHVVRLEARPPNAEGRGAVSVRDLVRNALRMFPQRLVVGECRGGEVFDILQAMSSGHEGAMTAIHAGSPHDALSRLETMVLLSGMDLPVRAVREQVASAIDIIVQVARLSDGSRRITHISEVTGMESDVINMHDIFVFEQQGLSADGRVMGVSKPTGFVPKFYEELPARGIKTDFEIFQT